MDVLFKTVKERGVLGLYKGLSALVIGTVSVLMTYFFKIFNLMLDVEFESRSSIFGL
jgi:hypothetical protein